MPSLYQITIDSLIDTSNTTIILAWLAIILIGIIMACLLKQKGVANIYIRKVFHLMAFLIFWLGMSHRPALMKLSLCWAIYCFI